MATAPFWSTRLAGSIVTTIPFRTTSDTRRWPPWAAISATAAATPITRTRSQIFIEGFYGNAGAGGSGERGDDPHGGLGFLLPPQSQLPRPSRARLPPPPSVRYDAARAAPPC